jgi:uncharacterized membrane protein YccC
MGAGALSRTPLADVAQHIAFVLRCSAAATLSYLLARALGLSFPVWASTSALVVSQERLEETRSTLLWRLAGTVIGIGLAVANGSLLALLSIGVAAQIACSVALCAALVHRWPSLRVSMWTVPIVYFSHAPGETLAGSGLWRGAEVVLGGLTGVLLHGLANFVMTALAAQRQVHAKAGGVPEQRPTAQEE